MDDIESLFIALGAEVTEGKGSRVRVALNDVRAVFHRPQPQRVTNKGLLDCAKILDRIGGDTMMENKGICKS